MPITVVEVPISRHQMERLGRLSATPEFLDAIPQAAFTSALRSHSHAVSERLETRHSFEGILFRICTEPDGSATTIWLESRGG